MRILQVSRQFAPAVGGIEQVVYGLSQALREQGHQSDVATLRYIFNTGETAAATDVVDGIGVYRFPHRGGRRYSIAPALLEMVRYYDVIHLHSSDFFLDFLSATQWHHQRPLVFHTHGGMFHTRWLLPLKRAYFHTITRAALGNVAAVLCDSDHDEALFRPITPPGRLQQLPNGVDLAPFHRIDKQIEPGLLLGIGRVVENKGIAELISVLGMLADEMPALRLVWVGPDAEGRVPGLMAHAARLGVAARVHFAGQLAPAALHGLLAQAHLFVAPATYEAFGVATIEAMSSGTVPLTTPVGVYPQVVVPGETGFMLPFAPEAAVAVYRQALDTPLATLAQMGAAARQRAAAFGWNAIVPRIIAVYEHALQHHPQSS